MRKGLVRQSVFSRMAFRKILASACMIVAACFAFAEIENPFKGADPEEWTQAKSLAPKVDLLPQTNTEKPSLTFLFKSLETTKNSFTSGNHQYSVPIAVYQERQDKHNKDSTDYDAEVQRYKDDSAAYVAAGGGGTYKEDDPKLAMLQSWHSRLVAWHTRIEAWRTRYNAENASLKEIKASLTNSMNTAYLDWKRDCSSYNAKAEIALKRAEFDKKIADMQEQIKRDKRALEYYKDKVPGLHADIEAMAKQADEAREEGRMAAIDKAIGLALDGAIASTGARELAARSQLKTVKALLIKNGVKPDDAKKVLKGWFDAPNTVPAIRRQKEMLEQLGLLRDMAAAYDSTTQKQYWQALTACLGVFVQTPVLKLAITNFEVYSNLMYTGLSYATAKARVNQYSKLADADLKAIAKISTVYQKHVKELVKLKQEREAIGFMD